MDHAKIITALITHFVNCEGTDYLAEKGEDEELDGLTAEENAELTRLRDEARKAMGWGGY